VQGDAAALYQEIFQAQSNFELLFFSIDRSNFDGEALLVLQRMTRHELWLWWLYCDNSFALPGDYSPPAYF